VTLSPGFGKKVSLGLGDAERVEAGETLLEGVGNGPAASGPALR
jgi:hypothetical protein